MPHEARQEVHDFVRDLYRNPALKKAFTNDPAEVLERHGFTAEERKLMLDASFAALGQLGMHPLVQMVYSLARMPAIAEQISFQGYLDDLK